MNKKPNIFILFIINIFLILFATSSIHAYLKHLIEKNNLNPFYAELVTLLYILIFFILLIFLSKYYLKRYNNIKIDFSKTILLNGQKKIANYLIEKNLNNNGFIILYSIVSVLLFYIIINSLIMKLFYDNAIQNILIQKIKNLNKVLGFIEITINLPHYPISNNIHVMVNNIQVNFFTFIIFVFLVPVSEEFTFRYVFYKMYNKKNIIFINTIVFLIYHFYTLNFLTIISAFYFSYFFLSRLYYYKKNLMLNIFIHSFINLFGIIYTKFFCSYLIRVNYIILSIFSVLLLFSNVFFILKIKVLFKKKTAIA